MGKTIEISLHSSSPIRFDKRDELQQRAGEKVATVYFVGNWVDSDRCISSCMRCNKSFECTTSSRDSQLL